MSLIQSESKVQNWVRHVSQLFNKTTIWRVQSQFDNDKEVK